MILYPRGQDDTFSQTGNKQRYLLNKTNSSWSSACSEGITQVSWAEPLKVGTRWRRHMHRRKRRYTE